MLQYIVTRLQLVDINLVFPSIDVCDRLMLRYVYNQVLYLVFVRTFQHDRVRLML